MLGVLGACSTEFFFKFKDGGIWCNLGVLEYVNANLKINNFKNN